MLKQNKNEETSSECKPSLQTTFLRVRHSVNNPFGLLATGLGVLAVTGTLLTISNAPSKKWDAPYTVYTRVGLPYTQQTTLRRGLSWEFGTAIASLVLFAAAYCLEIKKRQ